MKIQISSSFSIQVRYLWKKDNSFYYRRQLPGSTKYKFVHLGTSDPLIAAQRIQEEAAKDEATWIGNSQAPSDLNNSPIRPSFEAIQENPSPLTGNGVRDLYLQLRKGDEDFGKITRLAFKLFIDYCGDKPVTEYRRREINAFVAFLSKEGKSTATIRRRLKSLNAGFGLAIREEELRINNPFERIIVPGEHKDAVQRLPFSEHEMQVLRAACHKQNDDLRWMLAMLSDTGARLAEVVGLDVTDVVLHGPVPYIDIRSHPWRPLKTKASVRRVPLVGMALAAAKRAVEVAGTGRLFSPVHGRRVLQHECGIANPEQVDALDRRGQNVPLPPAHHAGPAAGCGVPIGADRHDRRMDTGRCGLEIRQRLSARSNA